MMFSAGEFVPEKLRLWDESDWSVDSLLPFEYGPSSAETAEGCGWRMRCVEHSRRPRERDSPSCTACLRGEPLTRALTLV